MVRVVAIENHRPDLREPVLLLLERMVPIARDGGALPLVELVAAVSGDRLRPGVRPKVEARGDAIFVASEGKASFSNRGPETTIELKRFDLRIPAELLGRARLVGDGVELTFTPRSTLVAKKLLLSARVLSIEVTSSRIAVRMDPHLLDQIYELN